jgi:hypothetical protein
LGSEAKGRGAEFTDKEKINLEIYAERQNDEAEGKSILKSLAAKLILSNVRSPHLEVVDSSAQRQTVSGFRQITL